MFIERMRSSLASSTNKRAALAAWVFVFAIMLVSYFFDVAMAPLARRATIAFASKPS